MASIPPQSACREVVMPLQQQGLSLSYAPFPNVMANVASVLVDMPSPVVMSGPACVFFRGAGR